MNKLLIYGSADNIPLYNCSGKTDEEWYAMGQKRPIIGWGFLIWGILVETLYFPVLYLFFKTNLVRFSCYKLIALLGFIDVITTVVSCFISGILFIKGAVYCNYPTIIYMSGAIGFGGWCCSCACTLVLVLNRVGDVINRELCNKLFEGKRTYFWILLILSYWFYVAMYTKAATFNSVIGAWISNPLVIENPSQEIIDGYKNEVQLLNNYILMIGVCSLYTLYCILVNQMEKGLKSKASKQVFIQSSIICSFNTFASICYNASILLPTPPWVILIGEMNWAAVHGAPAIIYITMNKTIRTEFIKMLGLSKRTTKKVGDTLSNNRHTDRPGTYSESQI